MSMSYSTKPLVSICIPTYNVEHTIKESLLSVINQTYSNFVIHVSDNASTDNTLSVVESFKDGRIVIHRHKENVGGEGNFNRCIQYAEGEYTAIFHADDIYESEMVSEQISYLDKNDSVGAVFTAAKTIDEKGQINGLIGLSLVGDGVVDLYDFDLLFKSILLRGNFIVCPSAMFRTNVLKNEIKTWNGDLFKSSADLDVWLRVSMAHQVAFLKKPLMSYRVDGKQFSNRVRMRTTEADFFSVTEYYLNNFGAKLSLKIQDQRNYKMLKNNDRLWRSINLFINGNLNDSRSLLAGMLDLDFVLSSIFSLRNAKMLFAVLVLRLFCLFGLKRAGADFLSYLRIKLNK